MNYDELIAKALNGRSVNSTARAWGLPQPTLDRYVKGVSLPDYDLAEKIFADAGVDDGTGFKVLAEEARNRKARTFKLKKQDGFVQTDLLFILGGGWIVAVLSILCQILAA
jgi:hypothetical protein